MLSFGLRERELSLTLGLNRCTLGQTVDIGAWCSGAS